MECGAASAALKLQKAELKVPQYEKRKRDLQSRTPKVGIWLAAADRTPNFFSALGSQIHDSL
jgi:hypothetical protein